MKKSRKLTLIILSIVSFVFLAAFAVLFFLMPTILEADGLLGASFAVLRDSYFYTFDKTQAPYLLSLYPEQTALILAIVQLVFTGLIFVAVVLGIVFVCTKKRPACILTSALLAFAGFVGALYIALGAFWLDLYRTFSQVSELASKAILVLVMFIAGALGFVLALVVYILSLVFVSKTAKESAALQEEISVIGEDSSDPEAVQEGDELDYAAPEVLAAPVVEPEPVEPQATEVEEEPVASPEPEPAVEPEPEPQKVEVNVNQNSQPAQGIDQASLATLLREVVRDIVRDEIARSNLNQPQQQPAQGGSQNITGATFGGPLVVQYFNGGINGVNPYQPAPQQEPAKQEVPAPAPVEEKKEEPAPEPVKEPESQPEPVAEEEPAPAPVAEPAPAPVVEVKPEEPKPEVKYERLTFTERLLQSEQDVHDLYNELKNEILSWGVKSRISANGDTFRLHKKMYVRITVAGKSLKLYFALNPADYANTTLPIQDASNKEMYQEIPLVFKVKSGLSLRRCKDLIQDVMEKDGLEQGEIGKVNWIKELKAEQAEGKKKEKASKEEDE